MGGRAMAVEIKLTCEDSIIGYMLPVAVFICYSENNDCNWINKDSMENPRGVTHGR
jgi:hypothetical protein